MSAPTVTTNADGTRDEVYPDEMVTASQDRYKRIVTYYPEISLSTLASKNVKYAILWIIVFGLVYWFSYVVIVAFSLGKYESVGSGKYEKYSNIAFIVIALVFIVVNAYYLATFNRVPATDRYLTADRSKMLVERDNVLTNSESYINFIYSLNAGQLTVGIFGLIASAIHVYTLWLPNSSANTSNTSGTVSSGGGKRKGSNRRRT
jgi:hypothetical protein